MRVSEKLIRDCLKGKQQAQFELYRACFPVLMSVCVRYFRQRCDAESALNQGFLKILMNIEKFDNAKPFAGWIKRIMINSIIDEYRKKQNTVHNEIVEVG